MTWLDDSRVHVLSGRIEWRNAEGRLHRAGGPAVIRPDGRHEWWDNGIWLYEQWVDRKTDTR